MHIVSRVQVKKYGVGSLWYGALATAAATFVGHYPVGTLSIRVAALEFDSIRLVVRNVQLPRREPSSSQDRP